MAEGTKHISEMLIKNSHIKDMNLARNQLRAGGAEAVCRMLRENSTLERLNLSGNYFKDDDAQFFDALTLNCTVKELDLSHNEFCGQGGEHLGHLLGTPALLSITDFHIPSVYEVTALLSKCLVEQAVIVFQHHLRVNLEVNHIVRSLGTI
ncbi:leucine-rich repeat-containing protein 74A-like [Latimeria chalumnae]|uniref:leucine-rich repeat-containing protein 74A-like n=1 Tax=Latimeria chalumnae TaxID=7897 RepID=UPI00313CF78F